MKWLLWLLMVGWVRGLLAPPLPPLPIDEAAEDHKFNIDGSPDEKLQLSLTEDKGGEVTITTTTEEEKLEAPEPPEVQAPISVQPARHIGPPAIRPPFPVQPVEVSEEESEEITPTIEGITTSTTEEITTSTNPPTTPSKTTTTTSTTTTLSTTSSTTLSTTTTKETKEPTDEPRILIPVPGEELKVVTSAFGGSRELIPEPKENEPKEEEKKIEPAIEEPMVLIPLPEEVTQRTNEPRIIISVPEETQAFPFSIETTTVKSVTEPPVKAIEVEEKTEAFFTREPMITVPLPEDSVFIPTIPPLFTIAKVLPFGFEMPKEILETITTLPPPQEKEITESEVLDDLVKGLPKFESTRAGSTTMQQTTESSSVSVMNSTPVTRRIEDVVVEVVVPQRTLHRGQLRKVRRKGHRGNNRRLFRIRPPTKTRKPHPFRNSSDVIRPTRPKIHHKVIRMRKKNGLSRTRIQPHTLSSDDQQAIKQNSN